MIFFDFEVFKHDWLVVALDMDNRQEHVIINEPDALARLYKAHTADIWVGFNVRHYDQYILKAILCGFDPKAMNDWIILRDLNGWEFSSELRRFPLIFWDIKANIDPSLKVFEAYMGHDIRESSVPFDIDRKLTPEELDRTVGYCRHDVSESIDVFLQRQEDFQAQMDLIKMYGLPLSAISKTGTQLAALILGAKPVPYTGDEFDIIMPPTLEVKKYAAIPQWYLDPANHRYKGPDGKGHKLQTTVAGVPHVFGWGGAHGALKKYHGDGWYLNMDVASLYPSLLIRYALMSRAVREPERYEAIRDKRLELKAAKDPKSGALKLVLNKLSGGMKDPHNALYDPRNNNRMCIFGQMLLLDLMEHLEPHCGIIQSNTDGVLVKLRRYGDYDLIDDIAYEWEQRTGLQLEFDEYRRVFQKDVNNYIAVDADGHYKGKGAYAKSLGSLDNDLPIINRALTDYMVKGVPVEQTIMASQRLLDFQKVGRATAAYSGLLHGGDALNEKTARVFASKDRSDGMLSRVSKRTGKPEKVSGTPASCFIENGNVEDAPVPDRLDREWYIDQAHERLAAFGV